MMMKKRAESWSSRKGGERKSFRFLSSLRNMLFVTKESLFVLGALFDLVEELSARSHQDETKRVEE